MTWSKLGRWIVDFGRFIGNLYALIVVLVLGSLALAGLFFVVPLVNHMESQTRGLLGLIGLVLFGFFLSWLARLIAPDLVVIFKRFRNHNVEEAPLVVTTVYECTRSFDETWLSKFASLDFHRSVDSKFR